LPGNVDAALRRIRPSDVVLDVGGWWKPFRRANYVVDLLPYETRGGGGSIGLGPERFTKETWQQADICEIGLPFADGTFDFVYCGQTLEDIRDPIGVCRELCRVARAGYIEVPSLWVECCYDVDALPNSYLYPGYEKHRWLVEAKDDGLLFIPKLSWMSRRQCSRNIAGGRSSGPPPYTGKARSPLASGLSSGRKSLSRT
jgi:hypothetical protein